MTLVTAEIWQNEREGKNFPLFSTKKKQNSISTKQNFNNNSTKQTKQTKQQNQQFQQKK